MFKRGIILALLILFLDQITKWVILDVVHYGGKAITVAPFFNLYPVWNKGVSFGMFSSLASAPLIFSALALIVSVILLCWLWKAQNIYLAAGLGAIIGGAVGNTIDRIRFGAVIDFLDFHVAGYHWPSFNIADSAIFLGVVALMWESIVIAKLRNTKTEDQNGKLPRS